MDFHKTFEETIKKFPSIRGIIFVDPDGESIVHYHPGMSEYEVRLTGAKVAVLVQSLLRDLDANQIKSVESETDSHFIYFQTLKQKYSLMVVSEKSMDNQRLKDYMETLSEGFNEEIL